jgi:hypothetical protein
MEKILGIPLPRGNLKFHTKEFERGRAFFNEDNSVQIDPVASMPEGSRYIRLIYRHIDTIFSLITQKEFASNDNEVDRVYWYICSPSSPRSYIYTTSSAHFEHIHFKGYEFSSANE